MSDSPSYQHEAEDVFGTLGQQLLAIVLASLAADVYGIDMAGATYDAGIPFRIPYAWFFLIGLGSAAVWQSVSLPARFFRRSDDVTQRTGIAIGFAQIVGTAVLLLLAATIALGGSIDLFTPGQVVWAWAGYGVVACALVQLGVGLVGIGLLFAGRAFPDLDG